MMKLKGSFPGRTQVASCRGQTALSDADYAIAADGDRSVGVGFRALRGCRVHAVLAGKILAVLRDAAAALDVSRKSAAVLCVDAQQKRLVHVLVALERARSAAFFADVDVRDPSDGDLALGGVDVSVACRVKDRHRDIADRVADAARFGSVVFCNSGDAAGPREPADAPPPAARWVAALVSAIADVEDAPMHDCRALTWRWGGVAYAAIANFDALVLCHAAGADVGDDAAVALREGKGQGPCPST